MNLKILLQTLLLSVFVSFSLSAQRLDHALGQMLIRVEPDANLRAFTEEMQHFQGKSTHFRMLREISKPMNIWLVSFDHTVINENDFLSYVSKQKEVETAQFNHLVKLRSTTPNDPQFPQQWQYINDGSNGGVVGADIDADLAWDISTGGVTANGDTIVVCIVDGGFDLNHEDWGDNLWVNHAEIPDNGIDDDNNGFIDDYYGWNTGTQNDDVMGSPFHGTAVAGIVGAQGDNGIGVAGVNWNVKLMLVVGGTGVESEVIEAYSYALNNRKKYNETGGAEGAFVVATNSSWGVDFGQPSDAPLWCAFYDTLGVNGILSAGATINDNQNVDVVGDLPTACPSDYLITVTNMDNTDNKVSFAGYGATTIDLGAFGQGTWTMANGGYGAFGGTSGATPHVTGAIALLYSAPCPTLASLALSDPQLAAEMVRDYILEGVDPNASLDGITTTGGRLNINNSIMMVMENCGPCPPPSNIQASDVTDTQATISWVVTDSVQTVDMRWRELGAMEWDTASDVGISITLLGLTPCTEYEVQLFSNCSDTTSGYTDSFVFQTDGCCEAPSGLHLTVLDSLTSEFQWNPLLAADHYQLLFTFEDGTTILLDSLADTTALGPAYQPCVLVTVQVAAVCMSGDTTDFSTPLMFVSPGCGACMDNDYCEPAGSTSFEYIESVELEDLSNTSGDNGGYAFFEDMTTTLTTYQQYTALLTPGFQGGTSYDENFVLWIDFNQDGDFDDPGEEMADLEPTQTTTSITFMVPGDALAGATRMRVGMGYAFGAEVTPCATEVEGEYEDYCITIEPGVPPPCDPPENVMIDDIGFFTASVSWEGPLPATSYELQYRKTTASDWMVISGLTQNTYILFDLTECTEYELRIATNCGDTTSAFSETVVFMTDCLPACDEIPAALGIADTTANSALAVWNATAEAVSYTIQWRPEGAANWFEDETQNEDYTIQPLDSCTTYEVRVRANCDFGVSSDYSDIVTFSTLCETGLFGPELPALAVSVSPNPFRDEVQILLDMEEAGEVSLKLYNATGQLLLNEHRLLPSGKSSWRLEENLLPGVYLLELRSSAGRTVVKLIKE